MHEFMQPPTGASKAARRLRAERLYSAADQRAAQRLRYRIFSSEFAARLNSREPGVDRDAFDAHCLHLGVRDLDSGALVATTRLLDHPAAVRAGRFYSEAEFRLEGLEQLRSSVLEVGRTCIDPAYRNGGTLAVLWGELAEIVNQGGYSHLMGCASIPMQDGGLQALAVMQQVRERYLCTARLRAEPRQPLPAQTLPENLSVKLPALLAAYLRLGAKVCGEPYWDRDFQVADLLILLDREQLCPRYARHFKTAV